MVLSLVPTPFTAVIMAIAMPAAIKPYSMAVAPELVLQEGSESSPHAQVIGDNF